MAVSDPSRLLAGSVSRLLETLGDVQGAREKARQSGSRRIGHFAPGNLIPSRTSRSPVIPNQ
jgi:hypothetical protein